MTNQLKFCASSVLINSLTILILISSNTSNAIDIVHLECDTADPEYCKYEFASLFEQGFRSCLVEYFKNIISFIENFDRNLLEYLPTENLQRLQIQRELKEMNDTRQLLYESDDDHIKLQNLFARLVKYRIQQLPNELNSFKSELQGNLRNEFKRFFLNIIDVWNALYFAVRENDLKEYPEYASLNAFIKRLPAEFGQRRYEILQEVFEFLKLEDWYKFSDEGVRSKDDLKYMQ